MSDESNQLDLFSNQSTPSQPKKKKGKEEKPNRTQEVASRNILTRSIMGKKGDKRCIEDCTVTIHVNSFGMTPKQLHEKFDTGGKRENLPEAHQQFLAIQETTVGYAIADHVMPDDVVGNQTLVNKELHGVADDKSAKNTKFYRPIFGHRLGLKGN